MKNILKLYLVTDRDLSLGRSLEEVVSEAVAGGVTIVQLREKDASTGEFVELAFRLKDLLRPYNVPLIINDRVDVALAVDAEGLHIGQSDMPYEIARKLLGPDKIIGLSVENMDDLLEANKLDVDYIGISPVFGTPTKTDTAEPFGLEGLRKAVEISAHPTVAIGGMNTSTIGDVMAAGTDGVAVVSAICSAESPRLAAKGLVKIIEIPGQAGHDPCSAVGHDDVMKKKYNRVLTIAGSDSGGVARELAVTYGVSVLLKAGHLTGDVLTVYKAKGLEFETVMVYNAVDGTYPFFSHKNDEEKQEDKRLFYVAMSRAKKRLLISYCNKFKYYRKELTPFMATIQDFFEQ